MSRVRAQPRFLGLSDAGQGLVEYALILSLIAIVVIGALAVIGTQVSTTLSTIGQSI